MHLRYPTDGVLVVAGVAGAGKTTMIRRIAGDSGALVVYPEDRRETARIALPSRLLHARHFALTLRAVLGARPVIVHSRGTSRVLRRIVSGTAALRGREAHLLLLDAPRAVAEAGQRARGRTVDAATMEREAAAWAPMLAAARADGALRGERWTSVTVIDREQAAEAQIAFTGLQVVGRPALRT